MPYSRELAKEYNQLIHIEKQQLNATETKLRQEIVSLKNTRYLRLLSKASQYQKRIVFLKTQKQLYIRNSHKQIIVNLGSRVKLLSTRVGDVFFVDAKNYLELLGKSIGDAVTMNNVNFLIAGVY